MNKNQKDRWLNRGLHSAWILVFLLVFVGKGFVVPLWFGEDNAQTPADQKSESPSPVSTRQNSESPSPVSTRQNSESPSPVSAQQKRESPSPVPTQQKSESPSPGPSVALDKVA